MDIIERDIYALIASGDGIKAREIAKKLNKDRSTVNHYLYNSPYMRICATVMRIMSGTD